MSTNFDGIKQRRFGIEIEMTGITRCSAAKPPKFAHLTGERLPPPATMNLPSHFEAEPSPPSPER